MQDYKKWVKLLFLFVFKRSVWTHFFTQFLQLVAIFIVFWHPRTAHFRKTKRLKALKVESLREGSNKFEKRPSWEYLLLFSWWGSIDFCFWFQKSSDRSCKIGPKPVKSLVWTLFWGRNCLWTGKKESSNNWATSYKKQAHFYSEKEKCIKLLSHFLLCYQKRGAFPQSKWSPNSLFHHEKGIKTQIVGVIWWFLLA